VFNQAIFFERQHMNFRPKHGPAVTPGFIANWNDKIQGLFKDFQGPKIAVFKYQKYW